MLEQIKRLSNSELVKELKEQNEREHEATLRILLYLVEVERRRLYAEQGFSSMFAFCTDGLKYSEAAAYRRIQSARIVKAYPHALALLKERKVNLCALALIGGILERGNSEAVLRAISDKSRREVEAFVATFRPKEKSPREVIRPIAIAAKMEESSPSPRKAQNVCNENSSSQKAKTPTFTGEGDVKVSDSQKVHMRFQLKFSADQATMDKLDRARSFMGFKKSGSLEQTFDALLDFFLEHKDPVRRAARREQRTAGKKSAMSPVQPANATAKRPGRYIPARTREEVFAQSSGHCAFVAPDGKRCGETRHLEVDHIWPFAAGGGNESGNLRLLCRAHNRLQAEKFFGRGCFPGTQ